MQIFRDRVGWIQTIALVIFAFACGYYSHTQVVFAQTRTSVNLDVEIPLTIGRHNTEQPQYATDECDNNKYNCARRLPNEATEAEIADGLKRYGANTKIYAHGDRIWYVLGPFTRGVKQ